jgi:uncharacterized membrane protein YdjX (TVP38/TMEM64 family)
MRISKKYVVIIVWAVLVFFLRSKNIISFDVNAIQKFLQINEKYLIPIFIFLWSIRIFAFIPGVTFMVIGGICFGPVEAMVLSTVGIFISETIIYFISKYFSTSKLTEFLNRRYPDIRDLIKKYDYKFITIGIVCPIAPTDVICYLAACTGIKYIKFILIVIISNLPVVALYSFVGTGINGSLYIIAIVSAIIAILLVFKTKWNRIKGKIIQNV